MKPYFITGTDTDCGKTYVTTQLLKYFPNSLAIKPVASGCVESDGQLISSDALEISKQSGLSLDAINPWRFKSPVSPHIAAAAVGQYLSIKELVDYSLNFEKGLSELLFIEGAGGLLVPLNEQETWVDFLTLSDIPVILVVGMKLGCINHALLSATALATHKIKCTGWVANCIDPEMDAWSENLSTLTKMLEFPLLAICPYQSGIQPVNLLLDDL